MSNPLVPLVSLLKPEVLEPVFGPASAAFAIDFLQTSFEPFADSFPSLVGRVQRDGKGIMICCVYPLSVVYEGGRGDPDPGTESVTIGVLFTQAFPQFPPQVALLLQGKQVVVPGHPFVASNGAVRTALLDCGSNPKSMFDILASVITMMQTNCPLITSSNDRGVVESVSSRTASQKRMGGNNPTPSIPSSTTTVTMAQPSPYQQPSRYSDPQSASSFVVPPQPLRPSANEDSPPPSTDPLSQAVLSALLAQVKQISEHYIAARDGVVGFEGGIQEEIAAIDKELGQIETYEQEVQILEAEYLRCKDVLGGYTQEVGPLDELLSTTGSQCVKAQNDLHEQALELLASIHAHQDQLTVLEKALSKGGITTEQYLRYVSTVSREEFRCRALYRTVHNHVQKGVNEANLVRTFRREITALVGGGSGEVPDKEIAEFVRGTLSANNFDPEKASQILASMVRN